jgi:hypothetical protein
MDAPSQSAQSQFHHQNTFLIDTSLSSFAKLHLSTQARNTYFPSKLHQAFACICIARILEKSVDKKK